MWNTNKTPRQGVCTTYVGHRHLSILPKERRHWGLPGQILEAQAKLAGLESTHAPDGNSARRGKKERHRGISLSRNWSIFFIFRFAYILFVIHRDEYRVTRGQQTWPLSKSGASYKIIQRSQGFTSSSGHEACWHFMALSDNGQSTRKLMFFPGVIFS